MLMLAAVHLITTFQAVMLGLLQGVTELFPVSSLGHMVIFPHLFSWNNIVSWESQPESPWLAFVVMLHVGSAVGLLVYFWRDWTGIVRGFCATLVKRKVETSTERLAWLIVVATIPVGALGLALEHPLRVLFAKPLSASIFLLLNGLMLFAAERYRRRAEVRRLAWLEGAKPDGGRDLATLEYREAALIGVAQSSALIAGISRDGVCMAGGLARGLDNGDAGRFAFLLATPPILAAGLVKFGDLTGPLGGGGVRSAAVIAALVAALTAVATVHFLTRYLRTRNLKPFGAYCVVFGTIMTLANL